MKTKPSKLIDVAKLILIYSISCKKDTEGILNQQAFADYLNISLRTVARHFKVLKEKGLLDVTGKIYKHSKYKESDWPSNVYTIKLQALNNFIIDESGEDITADINNITTTYFDFMTFIRVNRKNKYVDIEESIEAKELLEERFTKEDKVVGKKMKKLIKKNRYYLDLLKEVNNDKIPLSYLEQNKKRLVSNLCATRNPNHDIFKTRQKMLENFFQTTEEIEEFDTNASIYRLSFALGHGYLAPSELDIYKLIFDKCDFKAPWTNETRYYIKQLMMPIYMRESSIKFKCDQYNKQKNWSYFISTIDEKQFRMYSKIEKLFDLPIFGVMEKIRLVMHEVLNLEKFYKADIFIYESNLHILMLKKFKDMGIESINIYDGFYFKHGTMNQELYNKIYKQSVEKLLS